MQTKQTPLMRQYWDVKSGHPDKILLFRMGDFFEIFHDDAVKAAPILGIALTKRNQKSADETPMCGVPHHSIGNYINKLLKAGQKVAICDQIEDPKQAKGLVKRAVTRILSPGMVFDPDSLLQEQPNYLVATDDKCVAFADASTGEAFYYEIQSVAEMLRVVGVLNPTEAVLSSEQYEQVDWAKHKTKFDPFEDGDEPPAARRLRAYVRYMQGGRLDLPLNFERRILNQRLELTQNTVRHLEIFETNRGEEKGSLFSAINRTKTPGGARKLRSWLAFPLATQELILARQKEILRWKDDAAGLNSVRATLQGVGDLERRATRLTNSNANARDLVHFCESLKHALDLSFEDSFDDLRKVCAEISSTIVDEPPHGIKEGGMIRRGRFEDLDSLIALTENGQELIVQLEAREKQKTGISSLKVRYNNVFGYSIEITNAHKDKVPAHYRRKQTLAGAERFATDELENLERDLLSAQTKRVEREFNIFDELKTKVVSVLGRILKLAESCNHLDTISSLSWLALESGFSKPEFSSDGKIYLEGSRHPVVERMTKVPFVANTIEMAQGDCIILTGPNMAGKSTLMRQVGITAILAQIGSFVPAQRAKLPIFDKILTRIGASDSLSEGLSTFMVEMKETAELVDEADRKSLVILDEVGRGTSTYDGMSLAQAILEHLLTHNRATIFFATHYHELTGLDKAYPHVSNCHMGIRERGAEISFLYSLKSGPANKSYGLHVAKLAGLPKDVIVRAEKILSQLESQKTGANQMSLFEPTTSAVQTVSEAEKLAEELRKLSIDSTTPLDALNFVARWRATLS